MARRTYCATGCLLSPAEKAVDYWIKAAFMTRIYRSIWRSGLVFLLGAYPSIGRGQVGFVNPAPFVIPALREWVGSNGYYQLPGQARLVVAPSSRTELLPVAKLMAEDMRVAGYVTKCTVLVGQPRAGDIYFTPLTSDSLLPAEGYRLEIGDLVTVRAKDVPGAIWATRSLLQLLAQDTGHRHIPRGKALDYPQYAVRGFVLDVGRKFFTIDFLRNYVKFMSYYKMNDFHIHLNDNGFKYFFNDNWDSTYAAFRLESETYPQLTARDGHYTKKEFIALQELAQQYGVNIIPEIDVPAHALAFSRAVPGIGSERYGQDHLDLNNPMTYTVVDNVFKEYLSGARPVFRGKEVHIGTDEYDKKEAEPFRRFTDHYIRLVESYGKRVRLWGALTHAKGNTPVKSAGVTMNLWYNGYAEPRDMFAQGFQGISTPDGWLYIVPAAGYYYDYLNVKRLYNEWTPSRIGKDSFPEPYGPLRGGSFAVWNDHVGNGITEKDVHHRVFPAMQVLAQKMWGGRATRTDYATFGQLARGLGEGPGLNMLGRLPGIDSMTLDFRQGKRHRALIDPAGETLTLSGGNSHLATGIPGIGYDYTVSFYLKAAAGNAPDAVLFGSSDATVTLNQQGSGFLGFSREGYHEHFNYSAPAEVWTHIVMVGDNKGTSLYVNGQLVEKLEGARRTFNNGKETARVQTLFFPLQTIGDVRHAARASIRQLQVFTRALEAGAVQRLAK
ncbi:family 20 glycosylhydrolase [Paraflavitalea pollutisoli]|uniref:family 20 glycosylhydrolase n=1 Tax=Paraflavitalea pollutisoli TaxID=3034143 RepID=UPI0023EC7785|nr:family 20 glycosylhydrolase [Paraflavitalea sp. H1-2-19X]